MRLVWRQAYILCRKFRARQTCFINERLVAGQDARHKPDPIGIISQYMELGSVKNESPEETLSHRSLLILYPIYIRAKMLMLCRQRASTLLDGVLDCHTDRLVL